MAIRYIKGNLLESNADALVNTVNTVGVMGKGIALQFKKAYPNNFKAYEKACKLGTFGIGQMLIHEENLLEGKKIIINFPTKTSWKLPSEYEYIEQGLFALREEIIARNIKSIALPPLGAGNGGLNWERIKNLIESKLSNLDVDIIIYEPNQHIQEVLSKERVKLTPARAMLLLVLHDLAKHGELVSEFAAEKIVYFLQRMGAGNIFKLSFIKGLYGPYSGKVRHVLYHLNGSYIMGYSSKDKKPFDELDLIQGTEEDIYDFLKSQSNADELMGIVTRTKDLLESFYSPFAMELLSTVDFVIQEKQVVEENQIIANISQWSERKDYLFAKPHFIETALVHLKKYQLA